MTTTRLHGWKKKEKKKNEQKRRGGGVWVGRALVLRSRREEVVKVEKLTREGQGCRVKRAGWWTGE